MLPLEGIKILDFSLAIMGPLSTTMLGDMGADVIKVERTQGEEVRRGRAAGSDVMYSEEQLESEKSLPDATMWIVSNRNKRSLAIDVRTNEGREIILKLAKDRDVFLHNFRPGTMDNLGLTYKDISQVNAPCTGVPYNSTSTPLF